MLVLGSCTTLQFGAALAVHLFPALGSWATTSLRLALAALVLLALTRPRVRRFTYTQWRAMVGYGLVMAGMNGFFYAALARLDLGVAVAMEFLGPLVLAACLSRRPRDLVWTGLALGGVALFFLRDFLGSEAGVKGIDPIGVVLVLAAAACWAGYVVAGQKTALRVPGKSGMAVGMALSALILLPFGAMSAPKLVAHPGLLLLGLGVALLSSVIPYSLELSAMRRLPKPVFGVLLSVEPVVAALAGWLLLGQNVGVLGIAAIALVVAASAGSTLTAAK